ncbi:VWA domain-containing protein [Photobacterium leiognathi]|uniref:VWA domain-containing protein n=1 Tax=Photobacterium leiognathi TaxID=553611 RepID=UPI00298170DC|nr:VWA domain-containing protein [Photobacterium leiognathi]
MKKQQGVAAIILVLILIPLFGCVFFALEGTRYIQKKTRLADAAEAAAIAVTDENPNHLKTNKYINDQNLNNFYSPLAAHYIQRYLRHIDTKSIVVTPYIRENAFYQYKVHATTSHLSWFHNSLIPSFNKKQSIKETGIARNHHTTSIDKSVDIVFVTDMSASMSYSYDGNFITGKSKFDILKSSINDLITNDVKNSNSRYALVPFDMRTQDRIKVEHGYQYNCHTHLEYKKSEEINNKENNDKNYSNYDDIDLNQYIHHSKDDLEAFLQPVYQNQGDYCCLINDNTPCLRDENNNIIKFKKTVFGNCQEGDIENTYNGGYFIKYKGITHRVPFTKNQKSIHTIIDLFNKTWDEVNYIHKRNYEYPDPFVYIDFEKTLNHIFEDKKNNDFIKKGNQLFDKYICRSDFWTIDLTKDADDFISQMNHMSPGGNTSVYQGLLKGANVINKGKNKNKFLILISDGDDAPYEQTLPKLIELDVCNKIKSHFLDNGDNFNMGMIGINYNAQKHHDLVTCFGKEYIYEANDSSILKDKIEQLIAKGQKSSGITKLSDGQN